MTEKEMFKEGNVLVIVGKVEGRGNWKGGDIVTVNKLGRLEPDIKIKYKTPSKENYTFRFLARRTKVRKERRNDMSISINNTVAEVFENTQDAILVQKHLGSHIIDSFIGKLNLEQYKEEVLAEAKRLQIVMEEKEKLRYVVEEEE